MPKSGTPYTPDRDYDAVLPEDRPGVDKPDVEELAPVPKIEEPIPVRVVEDSKPKQHITEWGSTRLTVPFGKTMKLLSYIPGRKNAVVKNDTVRNPTDVNQSAMTEYVLIGRNNQTTDVLGYALYPEQSVSVPGPNEIWVHNKSSDTDVSVSVLVETAVEIS